MKTNKNNYFSAMSWKIVSYNALKSLFHIREKTVSMDINAHLCKTISTKSPKKRNHLFCTYRFSTWENLTKNTCFSIMLRKRKNGSQQNHFSQVDTCTFWRRICAMLEFLSTMDSLSPMPWKSNSKPTPNGNGFQFNLIFFSSFYTEKSCTKQ